MKFRKLRRLVMCGLCLWCSRCWESDISFQLGLTAIVSKVLRLDAGSRLLWWMPRASIDVGLNPASERGLTAILELVFNLIWYKSNDAMMQIPNSPWFCLNISLTDPCPGYTWQSTLLSRQRHFKRLKYNEIQEIN